MDVVASVSPHAATFAASVLVVVALFFVALIYMLRRH